MRSTTAAVFSVVLCSAAFLSVFLFTFSVANAKDMQADAQCAAGGVVNQPCQDNTNGYVTQGHCTHINVCKADSWPKSPKGCGASGSIYSPSGDCPKAPQYGQGKPTRAIPAPTTTDPGIQNGTAPISSSIFDQAFSESSDEPVAKQGSLATTSLDGIEYLISDGEVLEIGAPLKEAAQSETQNERSTHYLGTVAGLAPGENAEASGNDRATVGRSYVAPIGTFTSGKTTDYVKNVDLTTRIVMLGTDAVHSFSDRIVKILLAASGLNSNITTEVVTIHAYESMYDQAGHQDLAPFVEPPWQKVSQTPFSYMLNERASNVGRLLREAASEIGSGSYSLLTADLTKSGEDFRSAMRKTSNAFGIIGNLSATLALMVVLGK